MKIGDYVKCIKNDELNGFPPKGSLTIGKIYKVTKMNDSRSTGVVDNFGVYRGYASHRFIYARPQSVNNQIKIL